MRYRALLLLASLVACGPDPQPTSCHAGLPDFSVLITAPEGPLPADTVVKLYYGARPPDDPEVLVVAEPATPQALFCYVSDRNGVYDEKNSALGQQTTSTFNVGGAGGESGAGGAGGESNGGGGSIEGLVCKLYTDGSARLEVKTTMYDLAELELSLKSGVCIVSSSITLEATDAGMEH